MLRTVNMQFCIDGFMNNFLHMVVVTAIDVGFIFRDSLTVVGPNEWHNHNTSTIVTITDFAHYE